MSMIVVNEDHYIYEVDYGAGNYNFTKPEIGTRYVFMALRTLIDPELIRKMFKQAHALAGCSQGASRRSAGNFEIPNWDPVSQKKMREALLS